MVLKSITSGRKIQCLPKGTLGKVGVKPWKKILDSFTAMFSVLSYIFPENRK